MVQLYGVIKSVAAVDMHAGNDAVLASAAELYLLEWSRRAQDTLLMQGLISPDQLARQSVRRQELILEQGEDILELIGCFKLDRAGLFTPISSYDYVAWYADQHEQHGYENQRIAEAV